MKESFRNQKQKLNIEINKTKWSILVSQVLLISFSGGLKVMKRPMTTVELFNKICDILKEKNKLPDILDYRLATHSAIPIKNYKFDLKTNLTYGGNEGIYLGLRIEYFAEKQWRVCDLGTFKTLRDDKKAMHIMADLLANFIIELSAYVNDNLDDFTWTGADVYMFDENGKRLKGGYSCNSMEAALKRKDESISFYR